MKKTRILSLILAFLMTASSLIACSESPAQESESQADVSAVESASDSASETEAEGDSGTHYYNDIEAEDFEGWTFGIASYSSPASSLVDYFTVEDITGDEFNDSLYNREIAVEDKFNIEIVDKYNSNVVQEITKSVTAGTGDFAIGDELMEFATGLASSKVILPLTDLELNLDNPYWDQGANETLTINGRMYYGLSDITFDHYESCAVLFYNGFHLTNNGIDKSPNDLYLEGKWTMDEMKKMMETVARDIDGNGSMEEGTDIFGLSGRILRCQPTLASCGTDIIVYDESKQAYVYDMTSDGIVAIGDKLREIMYDDNLSLMEGDAQLEFIEGRTLFDSHLLGDYRSYREKEDDYGIISWPSLEENTDGWVYVRNPLCIFAAADTKDTHRLSVIIEAIAAYSYDYVIDNYINKAVVGKGARDKDSADFIRDMMGRRYYDILAAYGLVSVAGGWEKAVKGNTYASTAKIGEKFFNTTISKTLDAYLD